jgi:transposase-like protein
VQQHAAEHGSQWSAIRSVGEKLGCSVEVLRRWVRQAERDAGQRPGLTSDERQG